MRKTTLILSLILGLMLAVCTIYYTGGTLRASVSRTDAPASDYPNEFMLVQSILEGAGANELYSDEPLDDAAKYTLVALSVTLSNVGLFDAEWLNVQLQPLEGDVAVYYMEGDTTDVPSRGTGGVRLKLITRASANAPRKLSIQYYVYGISRTITLDV